MNSDSRDMIKPYQEENLKQYNKIISLKKHIQELEKIIESYGYGCNNNLISAKI